MPNKRKLNIRELEYNNRIEYKWNFTAEEKRNKIQSSEEGP